MKELIKDLSIELNKLNSKVNDLISTIKNNTINDNKLDDLKDRVDFLYHKMIEHDEELFYLKKKINNKQFSK